MDLPQRMSSRIRLWGLRFAGHQALVACANETTPVVVEEVERDSRINRRPSLVTSWRWKGLCSPVLGDFAPVMCLLTAFR